MGGLDELELLEPANRGEWRTWLTRNGDSATSVWLAIGEKGNTVTTLNYEQAIEEALCFGWIDSTVRKLDDARYKQLFSRRKPGSTWSRINKERVARLEAEGKIAQAGLAAVELAKQNGSWNMLDQVESLIVPDDLARALASNPTALENFEAFAPSARKMFLYWIANVKRAEKRAERIAETVRRAAEGRRLTD
jgi:uncharacterized protein YdeI (YjbR/CyaY-like superfamily)